MSFSHVDPVFGPSSAAPVSLEAAPSNEASLVPAVAQRALASSQAALNDPQEIDGKIFTLNMRISYFKLSREISPKAYELLSQLREAVLAALENKEKNGLLSADPRTVCSFLECVGSLLQRFSKPISPHEMYLAISSISKLLDLIETDSFCLNDSDLEKQVRTGVREFWDVYKQEIRTNKSLSLHGVTQLCHMKDRAFYELLQPDSFSFFLDQAVSRGDWKFVEDLFKYKSSEVRFSAEMLSDAEKKVHSFILGPLKPQLLEEVFSGGDEEILQIGLKYPAYFLQWCFTRQSLPLMGEFLKRLSELPAQSIPTLFWVLDQFLISFDFSREVRRLIFDLLRKKEVSTELVLALAKRTTLPVQVDEYQYLTEIRNKFPPFKRAFNSWDAVQKETEAFDFERLEKRSLSAGARSYEIYETGGTPFQFLVYSQRSTKVDCEEILQERVRNGFLCTSLVSNLNASFYLSNRQYAMVLSVDPAYIVKTSCQDVSVPYVPHNQITLGFYQLHERLLLLTAYVDHLYRAAAKQKGMRGDEYSTLQSLMSYKQQYQESAFDSEIQRLRDGLGISQETDYEILFNREEKGQSWIQLNWLLSHYRNDPPILMELEEIKRYLEEVSQLRFLETQEERGDLVHGVLHIQPLQTAEELSAHTFLQTPHGCGDGLFYLYNEVDLNFQNRTPEQASPLIKAIFIDGYSLDQNPAQFEPILSHAETREIPVVVHRAAPRSESDFRQNLKRLVILGNENGILNYQRYYSLNKLLKVQKSIREEDLQDAVMTAIEHPPSTALPYIFHAYPHFSAPFIKEAFQFALKKHNAAACGILLDWFFNELKEEAFSILQELEESEQLPEIHFSDRRLALLISFLKRGSQVHPDIIGTGLCYAVSIGDEPAVRQILSCADQMDNIYIQEAICLEKQKPKHSLRPFDGFNPREKSEPPESLLSKLVESKPDFEEINRSFALQIN